MLLFLFAREAQAFPQFIIYQGRYTNNGVASTGTVSMEFRVTNGNAVGCGASNANLFWTSGVNAVPTNNGLFSAKIGMKPDGATQDPAFVNMNWTLPNTTYYIDVCAAGASMSPKEPIGSSVFSIFAASAAYAATAGGLVGLTVVPTALTPNITAQNIDNVLFADQFPGANAGAKIQACINALPATGGTCDARGFQGQQTISSAVSWAKPVRLILGQATFNYTGPGIAGGLFQLNNGADGSIVEGQGFAALVPDVAPTTINVAPGGSMDVFVMGTSPGLNFKALVLKNFGITGSTGVRDMIRFVSSPMSARIEGMALFGPQGGQTTGWAVDFLDIGTAIGLAQNNVIEKNVFQATNGGINDSNTSDVGLHVLNNGFYSLNNAAVSSAGSGLVVENNVFVYCNQSLSAGACLFVPHGFGPIDISNNDFEDASNVAIALTGGNNGWAIHNNRFWPGPGTYGIALETHKAVVATGQEAGAIYDNDCDSLVTGCFDLQGGNSSISYWNNRINNTAEFVGNGSAGLLNVFKGTSTFNSGSVGIGVASPGQTLDVGGIVNAQGFYVNGAPFAGGGSPWAVSGSNVYYNAGSVGIGTTNPSQRLDVAGIVNASSFYVNGAPFAGGASQWTTAGSTIYFNSGFVGIGTTGPTGKLSVLGNGSSYSLFVSTDANGGSGNLVVDPLGNVGIGTKNPAARLSVAGGGSGAALLGATGCPANYAGLSLSGNADTTCGNAYNILSSPTDPDLYINRPTGNVMRFRENNVDQMVIKSGGNVGIGTASPANRLQIVGSGSGNIDMAVNGRIMTGDANNQGGVWLNAGQTGFVGANPPNVGFWTAAGGWATLAISTTTGNVGVGTSSPQATLDINGLARLKTTSGTPPACTAAVAGSLGLTSGYKLCVCNGASWVLGDGATACPGSW